MAQNVEAIDDTAPSKPRRKKTKKPKRTEMQARSWPGRAIRSVLALAGLGLVMALGVVLGRATARA